MLRGMSAVVTLCIAALGAGCSSSDSTPSGSRMPTSPTSSRTASSSASTPTVDRASWTCPDPAKVILPTWARSGFSDPTSPVPHLVGTDQQIVAVPFGWPLRDHQQPPRKNKILWIAKSGAGPLHIEATERTTGLTVTRDLPDGPAPSYVDMPTAGCWRFMLSWANEHDEVFVRYSGPAT